jgi:hypothetical protein
MKAPSQRLAWATVVREEIDDLHRFFQEWFLGERPGTDAEFARVEQALEDSFALVSPNGTLLEREALLDRLKSSHGKRAGESFRIWVRAVRLRDEIGPRLLVSYEEWQETDDGVTARQSTAWFAVTPGETVERERLRWVHVHETWLPGRSPEDAGE